MWKGDELQNKSVLSYHPDAFPLFVLIVWLSGKFQIEMLALTPLIINTGTFKNFVKLGKWIRLKIQLGKAI